MQGCQIHFHHGPHKPRGCLQRAEGNFRLCNVTTPEQLSKSLVLPLGRNKLPRRIKWGRGPDSACGPCVCHLCSNVYRTVILLYLKTVEYLIFYIVYVQNNFLFSKINFGVIVYLHYGIWIKISLTNNIS